MLLSLLLCLPIEFIIAVATMLDARSLVHFALTCKLLLDIVRTSTSLRYMLALAGRGLCDGPPSPVTVMSRLELLKAYEEAWRTFSWSEHLTLDIYRPYTPPYVSAGTLVLPIRRNRGVRSFVVQSIPSPLRGVPGRCWQIELGFFADPFIIDATQDLLAVLLSSDNSCVLMRTLSTGQPHALSANEGIFHLSDFGLKGSWYVSLRRSKHEISGDFIGAITLHNDECVDFLLIWNWKTGLLHVNMQVGSYDDTPFSFLDDGTFVVLTRWPGSPGEIVLSVYQYSQQVRQRVPPLVRSYVLPVSNNFSNVLSLRFFPDVTARGGAPPGHFYADATERVIGIQITTTSGTVQELLVPVRALMGWEHCLQYRHVSVSVCHEPFLGHRLEYASRAIMERQIPPEKLPPALRNVRASQLRFAVCWGALLVFEHDYSHLKKLHILAF